ncbi:hypothetical protein UG56_017150 [Nocardioides luteus]|uniref:DUF1273 domain-containing protein n=2 Tax=Nocardioides luteus TaxID=1844 RepID=A0A1J4N4N6_9ACTN|nr:hypothetical protein UG56_017150 [Nocardioides luteus]
MMKIGITGHSNLTAATEKLVREAIRDALTPYAAKGFTGVTCLAKGADQVFAQVVLEAGGDLAVVLPSPNYRDRKVKPANLATFDELLSGATEIAYLPFEEPGRDAYMAASEELVSRSDLMVAVWDGGPAGGHGGTADVVTYAREQGRKVLVVWPDGAERE